MASENIKLIAGQQANFTVSNGYFYTFDHDQDNLLQKTDDGNTAFSYPFDTLLANTANDDVTSTEFDGVYFWSLQNRSDRVSIKQWKIENYVCKLQRAFNYLDSDSSHNYDSDAFSVEHYHTQFTSAATSGTSAVYIDDYSGNSALMDFITTSGAALTMHLGPNTNNEEEDVLVAATVSGGVTISGTLQYSYNTSDEVNFYTYLWMFNDYDGLNSTGALYKFDAYTGEYVTKYSSGAYSSVDAATFYKVDPFSEVGEVDSLAYVKGTNILFINTGAAGATLPYYGSMVMENVKLDEVTIITVYDLAMYDQNIYRLQETPDGTSTVWSNYSYLLSTLDAFVTSIALDAAPATIAANLTSTSSITARVKDQFLEPITSRSVLFSIAGDAQATLIGSNPTNTNSNGNATITVRAGDDAVELTVTAVVEQV